MYITVRISLHLNDSHEKELIKYGENMKSEIMRIGEIFKTNGKTHEYPYRNISNNISWNCKGVVLRQAKNIFNHSKGKRNLNLSYSSIWSEYSYEIKDDLIIITLGRIDHERKLILPIYKHDQQMERLVQGKYKEMTIVQKQHHWYAYIVVDAKCNSTVSSNKKMGIDVGIKNPAVVYTEDGKVKFFGNGRERAYVQRRYRKHIQKMQELHQIEKLKNFEHKLHRKLTYYDHKTSKEIIAFAVENDIGIIVMERLTNIKNSFKIEITKDIYLWSYDRIQSYIAYKAKLVGINIKYVDPRNTSKRCPICRQLNKPKDRLYVCTCGFHTHRDIVGARNIMLAL